MAPSTSTWDFDSYLAEQQRNHEDHEVRREQTFQRVLSALGGPVADPPTLPLDVLNAWDAHNGKVVTTELEAKKAKKQQMKVMLGWSQVWCCRSGDALFLILTVEDLLSRPLLTSKTMHLSCIVVVLDKGF